MNNTINVLSKIAKACLIIVSLLMLIGAIVVIGICVEVSEGGGSFNQLGEVYAATINSCLFTRAMAITGFVLAILSLVFSIIAKCSRGVTIVDTIIGTLCFIFGLSLSPLCSIEDILALSMSNVDAEDFGVGMAVMLILLVFFSFIRMILNIVALALKPKTAVNSANMAYGYNPQMGYSPNGYQQGYPQNGFQQGGYPQNSYPTAGYPQNGFQQGVYPQNNMQQTQNGYGYPQNAVQQAGYPQNGYPQNMQQNYPQNGFQQNGYSQGVNTYQNVNQNVNTAAVGVGAAVAATAAQSVGQDMQEQSAAVQSEQKAKEFAAVTVQNSEAASYNTPKAYVPPVVEAPAAATAVEAAAVPVAANTAGESWSCTNCGVLNDADSKFCQNCGMQK